MSHSLSRFDEETKASLCGNCLQWSNSETFVHPCPSAPVVVAAQAPVSMKEILEHKKVAIKRKASELYPLANAAQHQYTAYANSSKISKVSWNTLKIIMLINVA
jgi:hypothetical protein